MALPTTVCSEQLAGCTGGLRPASSFNVLQSLRAVERELGTLAERYPSERLRAMTTPAYYEVRNYWAKRWRQVEAFTRRIESRLGV